MQECSMSKPEFRIEVSERLSQYPKAEHDALLQILSDVELFKQVMPEPDSYLGHIDALSNNCLIERSALSSQSIDALVKLSEEVRVQLEQKRLPTPSQYSAKVKGLFAANHFGRANMLARTFQVLIDTNRIDDIYYWAINTQEKSFADLRAVLKESSCSEVQFEAAKLLNEIEARVTDYPMCSPADAAKYLGELTATNPSRLVAKAKQEKRLFAFTFGNAKTVQIPTFQFNMHTLGVYDSVPRLCGILSNLNDWGVYQWLTTFSDDLEMTPAKALSEKSVWDDMYYLAGLFKSESTFRDLSYVAEKRDDC